MLTNNQQIIYTREVIDFTTVAVEYCIFLEKFNEEIHIKEFTSKLIKILPLLYFKIQSIPLLQQIESDDNDNDYEEDADIGMAVTESDYNYILNRCTSVLGASNDYLEVFHDEMQFSDTPIVSFIAENIADIYQDIRNFAAAFERGTEELMQKALNDCLTNFIEVWGQILTNVLRALHQVHYSTKNIDTDINNLSYNQ